MLRKMRLLRFSKVEEKRKPPRLDIISRGEGGFLVAAVGRRDTARKKLRRRAREGSDTGR